MWGCLVGPSTEDRPIWYGIIYPLYARSNEDVVLSPRVFTLYSSTGKMKQKSTPRSKFVLNSVECRGGTPNVLTYSP